MNIRCIIVDDEPLALEILEAYTQKIPELEHVGSFSNGIEALQFLKQNSVDLILLDIEMPELTGIQLMKVLDNPPKVIFTTAYDQYAITSYELEAVDYLLKPIEFARFLAAIEKTRKILTANPTQNHQNSTTEESFFFIKTEHRIQRIEKANIQYIEGMKNYLRIVTEKEKYMTLQSFKQLQNHLPAPHFLRVHKSYIVAINKIDCIERNRIRIGDTRIPIGETYKQEVQKHINGLYL